MVLPHREIHRYASGKDHFLGCRKMMQAAEDKAHKSDRIQTDWMIAAGERSGSEPDPLGAIMSRLDQLLATLNPNGSSGAAMAHRVAANETGPIRQSRKALPDPRLVRGIIRCRQMRLRFFEQDLFADPAWDMLLDLTAARAEHLRVSVTSLCIASGVPTTTALRWIKLLEQSGLVKRIEDDTDRRRAFVTLTERGADAMARFFEEVERHRPDNF
ncbi:winged helix DNA-binding protein [Novosphingobium sp. NPDC080210]|uniref:winged helix DNA-binding protein n=1 Tax=Novosphingobium sp. NPDC080210 TaxID=3390596 RepID=UPI003D04BF22